MFWLYFAEAPEIILKHTFWHMFPISLVAILLPGYYIASYSSLANTMSYRMLGALSLIHI